MEFGKTRGASNKRAENSIIRREVKKPTHEILKSQLPHLHFVFCDFDIGALREIFFLYIDQLDFYVLGVVYRKM